MKLRPRAEVICFNPQGTRVLCGYSPEGYTMFPGGGIDPEESAMAAAKREALEETDRRVTTCTVAHAPTVQVWPEGYGDDKTWSKGYQGGLTYWMTGSASPDPVHEDPKDRHEDYEQEFGWKPIAAVLERLENEVKGDWAEDVKVRIAVLQDHKQLHQPQKHAAEILALTEDLDLPSLSLVQTDPDHRMLP